MKHIHCKSIVIVLIAFMHCKSLSEGESASQIQFVMLSQFVMQFIQVGPALLQCIKQVDRQLAHVRGGFLQTHPPLDVAAFLLEIFQVDVPIPVDRGHGEPEVGLCELRRANILHLKVAALRRVELPGLGEVAGFGSGFWSRFVFTFVCKCNLITQCVFSF